MATSPNKLPSAKFEQASDKLKIAVLVVGSGVVASVVVGAAAEAVRRHRRHKQNQAAEEGAEPLVVSIEYPDGEHHELEAHVQPPTTEDPIGQPD